ncbi:hypothetical protein DPA88_23300 [Salmonella enterica subsp. salamae]|nr:hypothetical protein [Salmonella enterica]ECE6362653.1 hypothetical protein [Salmonella enterica subsp. salamae]ECI4106867.1 hypothetical protein [Salmonella enterica subsp. salamae]ECI4261693.1 hypothetical protein [Salmonella enterica subsp. salamae]ECI4313274.1 hypothetical protein [Salmonella enterica subsp. salamae]
MRQTCRLHPERPRLHHRASRENPAHKEPAALLPQLQALQSRMNALEQARNGELTTLKQQIADLKARQADDAITETALKPFLCGFRCS